MSEPKTLLLTETGVARLPDGSVAVNVGPIVRALEFLTEGRGEDRGTDELGNPLPDLMSLAFDVVQSIILGGRKADYFRRVKHELEIQGDAAGQSSLALAKQAKRVQPRALPTAFDKASDRLRGLLDELEGLPLDERAAQDLTQALEAFRSFGADRWVSATAQLLVALGALGVAPHPQRARRRAPTTRRKTASAPRKTSPEARNPPSKASSKPRKSSTEAKPSRRKRRAAPAELAAEKKRGARKPKRR